MHTKLTGEETGLEVYAPMNEIEEVGSYIDLYYDGGF